MPRNLKSNAEKTPLELFFDKMEEKYKLKFDIQRSNEFTRYYFYSGDLTRAEVLEDIAFVQDIDGYSLEYRENAPGSSVGRLEITPDDGGRPYKMYLKPIVKISTNFNAMLTELLPMAMLANGTKVLFSNDGYLTRKIQRRIIDILSQQGKDKESIQKLIDQLEEKNVFVREKRQEIENIFYYYIRRRWYTLGSGKEKQLKWLGYDKVAKNFGYVDRADVQLSPTCKISLKSVMPTDLQQHIFLCNTTFNAFLRDMKTKCRMDSWPKSVSVTTMVEYYLRKRIPIRTYGDLIQAAIKEICISSIQNTYFLLHYILGDYRPKLRQDGTGYNHIVLSSRDKVKELGIRDHFIAEALNERPTEMARIENDNGTFKIVYGKLQESLLVSFVDKQIKANDASHSLKFKILEEI